MDVVATEINEKQYGEVRVYGSIGWGVGGFVTGYLMNEYGPNASVFTACTLGVLFLRSIPSSANASSASSKSLKPELKKGGSAKSGSSLMSSHVMLFFVSAAFMGITFSTTASSLFIYIKESWKLNSSLMGLTTIDQVSLELPAFQFSSKIISKSGLLKVAIASHAFMMLRLALYICLPSFMEPLLYHQGANLIILPVELLHGPAFALYFSSGMQYAQDLSPSKDTASVNAGLFGSVFTHLGGFLGSHISSIWSFSLISTLTSLLLLITSMRLLSGASLINRKGACAIIKYKFSEIILNGSIRSIGGHTHENLACPATMTQLDRLDPSQLPFHKKSSPHTYSWY